jgi:uncharacterized protein (DUF2267 family)
MTTHQFYREVMASGDVPSREAARRATAAVFHALRDRLQPTEADHAAAQLPVELQRIWHAGEAAVRAPARLHREKFYERVRGETGLARIADARSATRAVFRALDVALTPGESEDVVSQLPGDLKDVWCAARSAA